MVPSKPPLFPSPVIATLPKDLSTNDTCVWMGPGTLPVHDKVKAETTRWIGLGHIAETIMIVDRDRATNQLHTSMRAYEPAISKHKPKVQA